MEPTPPNEGSAEEATDLLPTESTLANEGSAEEATDPLPENVSLEPDDTFWDGRGEGEDDQIDLPNIDPSELDDLILEVNPVLVDYDDLNVSVEKINDNDHYEFHSLLL